MAPSRIAPETTEAAVHATPRLFRKAENPPAYVKKTHARREVVRARIVEKDLPPVRRAMRFERGELPLFVLVTLRDYGPQKRSSLYAGTFTSRATDVQKQRVNQTLVVLGEKGYLTKVGVPRMYLYVISKAGLAWLKTEQKKQEIDEKIARMALVKAPIDPKVPAFKALRTPKAAARKILIRVGRKKT